MGLFNVITINEKCPKCKKPVQWQSKELLYDGFLLANIQNKIKLNERMDGEMHIFCDFCKISFDVSIEKGKITKILQEDKNS